MTSNKDTLVITRFLLTVYLQGKREPTLRELSRAGSGIQPEYEQPTEGVSFYGRLLGATFYASFRRGAVAAGRYEMASGKMLVLLDGIRDAIYAPSPASGERQMPTEVSEACKAITIRLPKE